MKTFFMRFKRLLKRLFSREAIGFLTTLMACAAFLVGAVKVWGVAPDQLWGGLLWILLMLVGLILLALLTVTLIKLVRRRR